MKYSPIVGFDWIFDNIFSYLKLKSRQKERLTELGNFSWFFLFMVDLEILNLIKSWFFLTD